MRKQKFRPAQNSAFLGRVLTEGRKLFELWTDQAAGMAYKYPLLNFTNNFVLIANSSSFSTVITKTTVFSKQPYSRKHFAGAHNRTHTTSSSRGTNCHTHSEGNTETLLGCPFILRWKGDDPNFFAPQTSPTRKIVTSLICWSLGMGVGEDSGLVLHSLGTMHKIQHVSRRAHRFLTNLLLVD